MGMVCIGWLIGFAVQAAALNCGPGAPSTLFVIRRSWHIDIGFAAGDLVDPLSSVLAGFPGARYLAVGFGDRQYLAARHRGAPALLRALWPGPGVLLVTALRAPPAQAFGASNVIELPAPCGRLLQAQAFVWEALADSQKSALLAHAGEEGAASGAPGPYAGSVFFGSADTYSAIHTCNTWAAEVLEAARMPVASRGVIFAGQLWRQLQKQTRINRPVRQCPAERDLKGEGAATRH